MTATATREALREVARDVLADQRGGDAAALVKTMARLDWYALLAAPGHGGVGAGLGSALILVEELAAAGALAGYLHDGILAPVVLDGLPDRRDVHELGSGLVSGERHAWVVLDAAYSDRNVPEVTTGPGGLVVTGRSGFLAPDDAADLVIVLVRDGAGHKLVMLPADAPGMTVDAAGGPAGRTVRRLTLAAVPVAEADLADVSGDETERLVSAGALAATAQMVGAAGRCLELTLGHVRARAQFGRPLAGFQAVQLHCADLAKDVDSSRCMLYRAIEAFDAGAPERHLLASMAKSWANEACTRATQTAHMLHGALAFTAEYELHRHSATVLAGRLGFGSARFHRARIARYLITNRPDWSAG